MGASPAKRKIEEAPAPIGRRERNKHEKRARIVAAAGKLFADKGFADTTTLEIAEAADIGTGTLFLYARSKEDLLVLVFKDEMVATAKAAFEALDRDAPLVDQLIQLFSAMMSYHARDLELARILLKEIMFPGHNERLDDIAELMEVIFDELEQLLANATASGELRGGFRARLVAETLFSNYFMDMLEWLRGRISREACLVRLRDHLDLLIAGLRRAPTG